MEFHNEIPTTKCLHRDRQIRCESSFSKIVKGGLTSENLDLLASRKWTSILGWIQSNPTKVSSFVDTEGHSVLHHLCLFRAPLNVIKTGLSIAPDLAKLGNDEGDLPLHWAARLALPINIVAALLEANSKAGFARNRFNETPLTIIWMRHRHTLVDVHKFYGRERLASFNAWKMIKVIIDAYCDETYPSNYALHAIVQCPCEKSFCKFAASVYNDYVDRTDEKGNLPLHLACASSVATDSIKILLEVHPEGASIPDGDGNLPLHLALASGRKWHEGVEEIFLHNPSATEIFSMEQHLYPFMISTTRNEACLSTTYELLKKNPEHIIHALNRH